MIEMILLHYEKQTDNKLRWDAKVDDTQFELYIPKWRVPEPWPSKIFVEIIPITTEQNNSGYMSSDKVKEDPTLASKPIYADVVMKREHTKTIRYCPEGDKRNWEIGEPYIPKELTHDKAERLRIYVEWDLHSRGQFFEKENV